MSFSRMFPRKRLHGLTTISGKSVVCMRLGLVDEAFF
jgi:hypothetical protein